MVHVSISRIAKHSPISSPSLLLYTTCLLFWWHIVPPPLFYSRRTQLVLLRIIKDVICARICSVSSYTLWSPTCGYVFGLKKTMSRMETAVGKDICCVLTTAAEVSTAWRLHHANSDSCKLFTLYFIVDIFSVGLISMGVLALGWLK